MEKEETQAASRKEDLPASVDGGGSGHGLSLKGTEQNITVNYFSNHLTLSAG